MMISSLGRRFLVAGGLLAVLTGGSILAAGSAEAATGPGTTVTTSGPQATPLTLAPSCITFTQYKHGNFVDGYYTNVYIDNGCNTPRRVKVIMRHGHDSGCLQIPKDKIDYFFRSYSDDSLQPYVDRLDSC